MGHFCATRLADIFRDRRDSTYEGNLLLNSRGEVKVDNAGGSPLVDGCTRKSAKVRSGQWGIYHLPDLTGAPPGEVRRGRL